MEIGAVFILALVFVVLVGVGVALYRVAWRLRHEKLHPGEDRLEARRTQGQDQARPEHLWVGSEEPNRPVAHGDPGRPVPHHD
ncbi:MAG TPA: hypothetical protein VIC05_01305 [Solirubrobacteraceae bacterium]|jgi:hypothetical protein